MTGSIPVASAALAGVPAGVQSQGVWAGRRQLFVRFAGEAETATMYSATALIREMGRQLGRSKFHSVSIGGRDPLANVPFLIASIGETPPGIPVMLDTDGERPSAVAELAEHLSLVQVTLDFSGSDAGVARAMSTLEAAATAKRQHALVLCPREDTAEVQVLRIIEQASSISAAVEVVIHPTGTATESTALDRRWATLLEQAVSTHADCRLTMRIPPPAGMR